MYHKMDHHVVKSTSPHLLLARIAGRDLRRKRSSMRGCDCDAGCHPRRAPGGQRRKTGTPISVDGLREVAAATPAIADVRGLGLMVGSEFCHLDGSSNTLSQGRPT